MELNNIHVVYKGTPCSDPSDTLQYVGIVLTGVLSTLALLCSSLLLVMVTSSARRGDTFTMTFIRFLCAADVLTCGFYGLLKTFLSVTRPPWVNCFLAESALSCTRIAVGFTLVMWLVDLYYYATDPARLQKTHKTQDNHIHAGVPVELRRYYRLPPADDLAEWSA